ncbi:MULTISPECIES: peroxiredoxin [unclassified Devosia]|uniref:peroxiredoxin n=1 Tax=unclassified Devosia TaxID=196773 RepID=UPI001555A3D3|nr:MULTISPECIES: peroxiredoxin [unclassified Devosia]
MIKSGDALPSVPVKLVGAEGSTDTTSDAVLGTGTVVLFTVPGAFTPGCHVNHLPGFIANEAKLRAQGVDRIVCAAVNDHHVMKAWAEASGAVGKIDFLADGNGELADAMGLSKDLSVAGMGKRFMRSALVIRDGVVQIVAPEEGPGITASGAPAILMALEAANTPSTL